MLTYVFFKKETQNLQRPLPASKYAINIWEFIT